MRHGQTTANAKHIYAGEMDVLLTQKGEQQAAEAADRLPSRIDVVVCSPLTRARETAQIALQSRGFNPDTFLVDERLREKHGGAISGLTYTEIAQKYPAEWDRENTSFEDVVSIRFPQGESDLDVVARVEEALAALEQRYHNQHILIVAHAGIMLAARYIWGKSEQEVLGDIPSCGIDVYPA